MSIEPCRKCARIGKQGNAVLWCIQCKEECCDQCVIYHKAFKNYENHKFLDLAEYHLIYPILIDINETCNDHGNRFEYFCQDHNVTCCRLCKEKDHSVCAENISDLKTENFNVSHNANINIVCHLIDKVDKNMSENVDTLNKNKNEIASKLQKQKYYLQDVIQSIEEKQRFFAKQFDDKKNEIATLRKALREKRTSIEERRKLPKILGKIRTEDSLYFLYARKLAKLNQNDFDGLNKDIENLSKIQCNWDIQLSIGDDKIPRLIADVKFAMLPSKILTEVDDPDHSSSTVEDEEGLQNDKSANNYLAMDNQLNDFTSDLQVKGASCDILKLKDSFYKQEKFRRVITFQVEKRTGKTSIKCANMLMSGEVILGEFSLPRLMIYQKQTRERTGDVSSATRIGEFMISHGPRPIVIIDNLTVAYTASNYVGIVKIDRGYNIGMKLTETIDLEDKCFGLAYSNNKIIANCERSGIKVLSLKGEVMFVNPNLTGIMSICAGRNDEIFFVQRGQRKVLSAFITNETSIRNICSTEQCPKMLGANGVASDGSGLIYVSCDNSDKIYIGKRYACLKPQNDIIQAPLSIAFNAQYKELVIVNKDGKGISIFKKY